MTSPGVRFRAKVHGIDVRMAVVGGYRAARAGVERMVAWRPERILVATERNFLARFTAERCRAFRFTGGRR